VKRHLPREPRAVQTAAEFLHEHAEDTTVDAGDVPRVASAASYTWRVGKPLHGHYEGRHGARRGTYRILYKIDESKHAIEIRSIRHRADAYRT
jgi:hypothetical protein